MVRTFKGQVKSAAVPRYVLVGAGGFVGAIARYVVARLAGSLVATPFPFGTFAINVSGSFLIDSRFATLVA